MSNNRGGVELTWRGGRERKFRETSGRRAVDVSGTVEKEDADPEENKSLEIAEEDKSRREAPSSGLAGRELGGVSRDGSIRTNNSEIYLVRKAFEKKNPFLSYVVVFKL